ncbi:MAG: hypothetical protein JSU81_09235 [Candidatus Coatesbacteria bacterium]|nr:MAG: hypothetical protein JSU81_09235 [Candidatus Coatesbacteria bacterium]
MSIPGIYIAAAVTSALALAVLGFYIFIRAPRGDRPLLILAAVANFALSPLAYHLLRMPLDRLLAKGLGAYPGLYLFVKTLYAPLTEEPAKLWLLLIPWFVHKVTRKNATRLAMALGLGFGVGEIWLLAQMIASHPEYAAMPWYYFGGFMSERFMVCLMHGAFTAAALWRFRRGFVFGVLAAMGLHYLGNFPIFVAAVDPLEFGKQAWGIILSFWVIGYFLLMLTVLAFFAYGKFQPGRLFFGLAKCPSCGTVYPRPFWGANLGTVRYERCPACKKWHRTREFKVPRDAAAGEPVRIHGYDDETSREGG